MLTETGELFSLLGQRYGRPFRSPSVQVCQGMDHLGQGTFGPRVCYLPIRWTLVSRSCLQDDDNDIAGNDTNIWSVSLLGCLTPVPLTELEMRSRG
jgi:hypothetical protein